MSATNDLEVRRFRMVAAHRFEDAQALLDAGRNTGAIYLAGYAVECALKALLLSTIPRQARPSTRAGFRGKSGHDFEWIKTKYLKAGGAGLPHEDILAFAYVNVWTTEIRYDAGLRSLREPPASWRMPRSS